MKGAIRDSIDNVLGKDAQDLIASVQEKLDQASQGLKTAQKSISRWMSQKSRKRTVSTLLSNALGENGLMQCREQMSIESLSASAV
jgi:hypothetical protein